MRRLVATVILAMPSLAMGQDRIPEPTLRQNQQACVSECTQNRGEAYCAAVCSCVTDELRQHFTAAEFEARTNRLSENEADPEVQKEMNQMAAYCARSVGQ